MNNGDIVSNIELEPVIEFHRSSGSLFTMVLAGKGPPPSVAITSGGEVTGIGAEASSGGRKLGYTGIALLSPEALRFFPRGEQAELVPILKNMIHQRPGSVAGFEMGIAPQEDPRGTRILRPPA